METLIHADIFFFISSIALVIIALVIIVILAYIAVAEDFKEMRHELREDLKSSGASLRSIFNLFGWFASKRKK